MSGYYSSGSFNYSTSSGTNSTYNMWSQMPDAVPLQPRLRGAGQFAEFSTCTDLITLPQFIWDVNHYYRDLRVPTDATSKEMRIAYMSLGGQDDARLTYVFKQLLNKAVRFEYDRCPLGSRFMDDYLREEIMRRAKNAAAMAATVARERYGQDIDPDDIFKDLMKQFAADSGWEIEWPDEAEMLDKDAKESEDSVPPRTYDYCYYQWKSVNEDTDRLIEWQDLLVSAFRERRLTQQIALGYVGRVAHRFLLAKVGYRLVVFLHDEQTATVEMAQSIAARVEQEMQPATSQVER